MIVQVAYVGPEGSELADVEVPPGACVADALDACAIVERLGLFEAALSYAIHGRRAERDTPLRAGDRVELLRALAADPKDVRRKRAAEHPLARPTRRPRNRGS